MLADMIRDLCSARTAREQEYFFRRLEKLGIDRRTALLIAMELNCGKEKKKNEQHCS